MYRVGLPLWKQLARLGVPMLVRVHVHYDPDAKSYWTSSPDLSGLIVTGETLDEVLKEARIGIDGLMDLELGHNINAEPQVRFAPEALCAA